VYQSEFLRSYENHNGDSKKREDFDIPKHIAGLPAECAVRGLPADKKSGIRDELGLRTGSIAGSGSSGLTRVLDYMVSVQEIDYWAIRFLGEVGKVDPAATLSVLLRRIEVCDGWSDEDQKFRPVPFGQAIVPHELQFFSELGQL
jgi:hypothetical protein